MELNWYWKWTDRKYTHAFTLCLMNDDASTIVVGMEMTPADPVSVTSLRMEHYGALGVAVIITCLIHIHGVTTPLQSMIHHIDSTTVCDRLNKRQNTLLMRDSELSGTDYDVWAETDNLLKTHSLTYDTNMSKDIKRMHKKRNTKYEGRYHK